MLLAQQSDLPFENLLTTEEKNKAKRAKRFKKAAIAEQAERKYTNHGHKQRNSSNSSTEARSTRELSDQTELPFGTVVDEVSPQKQV